MGAPAMPEVEARRIIMAQRKLPDMRRQLRDLEARVTELTAKIDSDVESGNSANSAA
jgi:uncharacterized protein YlxW (UPF0749 family)